MKKIVLLVFILLALGIVVGAVVYELFYGLGEPSGWYDAGAKVGKIVGNFFGDIIEKLFL